eukprot:gene9151-10124_t
MKTLHISRTLCSSCKFICSLKRPSGCERYSKALGIICCPFSTTAGRYMNAKENFENDAPIPLSGSPLKNFKASNTFGGKNFDKEPSAKPIIIGGGIGLVLLCGLMFFTKGDSEKFNPFSEEARNKIQQAMISEDRDSTSNSTTDKENTASEK